MDKKLDMFTYKISNDEVCITSCDLTQVAIEIPEEIEGYKVTALGDYACSPSGTTATAFATATTARAAATATESALEEIVLPKTVRKIGRYAFYNCRNLRRLQFANTLRDLGAGAFTGCHKVCELDVTFVDGEQSCLGELMIELPEEQTLYYRRAGMEAKLIFPEFFEEAVENTPARILETHTHGSGMMYRNCFVRRELQFRLYDERFEWAVGRESEDTLYRLVFARLLYPYQLGEKAKERYLTFLQERLEACGEWVARRKDDEALRYLAEHVVEGAEQMEDLIAKAEKHQAVESIGYLMEQKRKRFQVKRKTFAL